MHNGGKNATTSLSLPTFDEYRRLLRQRPYGFTKMMVTLWFFGQKNYGAGKAFLHSNRLLAFLHQDQLFAQTLFVLLSRCRGNQNAFESMVIIWLDTDVVGRILTLTVG